MVGGASILLAKFRAKREWLFATRHFLDTVSNTTPASKKNPRFILKIRSPVAAMLEK